MKLSKTLIAPLLFIVPALSQTEANVPTPAPTISEPPVLSAPTERAAPPPPLEERLTSVPEPETPVIDLNSDVMQVPTPVSTAGYSMEFASETLGSNYLSGGLMFMSTYDDNISRGFEGRRIRDDGYTFMPTFAWRQTSSRVQWNMLYAPGFTVFHHDSELNHSTHNLGLESKFRLSPHVTLTLRDSFVKTSDPFNQFVPALSTSLTVQQPITTVVSPLSDQIANSGSLELTYQFGLNSMIGATGLFSDLRYLNTAEVQGLSNSHSKGGEAFYSHRLSRRHYLGAKYQFQSLLATPSTSPETRAETHGVNVFYTIYFQPTASVSFYAGPQYSITSGAGVSKTKNWSPWYGGSFEWQGQRMSFAIGAGRSVSAGGGLEGAIRSENASASIRGQLSKSWSAGLTAFYGLNSLLMPQFSTSNGHSISGTVSLHRQLGNRLGLDLGYTRLHQAYAIANLSPNTNRVWLGLSYQVIRPIGR